MSTVQIYINRLLAKFSSSFHFKLKIVVSSSPNKESVENKHSFKYDKDSPELNIYEPLNLNITSPLTSESKLQLFLEVYTKTGYKTAGVGVLRLSKGIMTNVPIRLEIKKCPLGKGYLEIQFTNFSIKPSLSKTPSKKIKSHRKQSKDKTSEYSDTSFFSNTQNNTSNVSYITDFSNFTNVEPEINNYNTHNPESNNILTSNNQITDNYYTNNPNIVNIENNDQINNNYLDNNNTNNLNNITYTKIDNTGYNHNSSKSNNIIANIDSVNIDYNINKNHKNNNLKNNNIYDNTNIYNNNDEIIKEKDRQINELKHLIKDFKKQKKALIEEKNDLVNQEKEKLQKIIYEKEDLQMNNTTLKEKVNILQNNKDDLNHKIVNIRAEADKQINDLIQQIKKLDNIKYELENDNKAKDENIIALDRKYKEMSSNFQKKIAELSNNYSIEKNNNYNYNEQLKEKEEEIERLNIKITSMEENIQSLNDIIELNDRQKEEKEELTANMNRLLEKVSSKDRQIFDLKKQLSDINNKLMMELNNKKTQNMLKEINEKELKSNISELENAINEKDNELNELRTKYENLKYNSRKPKIHYMEDIDDEPDSGLLNQIEEIRKTYKEREEKLLKEKNDEIKRLKMKIEDLTKENYFESNNNSANIKNYINEIDRLKTLNSNLEEDLGYYKELNNKFADYEKRTTIYENENVRLQNLLKQKNSEIDSMYKNQRRLEEEKTNLEKELVTSKGKLGDVLNELAEAETKCAHLEEEQKLKRSSIDSGEQWY